MSEDNRDFEKHYRCLENMHHAANCNVAFFHGIKMTVSEGSSEIILPTRSDYFHAAKAVHGFVYFKMLDEAAFFAANSLIDDVFVLTTDFHINLLRPVIEGDLRVTGKVTYQSRNQILAESVLYNKDGKQVARGSGTFVKGATLLNSDIGYG